MKELENPTQGVEQLLTPKELFKDNYYWSDRFSKIIDKPSTQKSSDLQTNLSTFVPNICMVLSRNEKDKTISNYFEAFEYVFSTLEPEFKKANMQKVLETINSFVYKNINDNGDYGQIHIYDYSVSSEPSILELITNFQTKFLFNKEYDDIFDDIKKTNRPDNTKNIIQMLLCNMPVDISKSWVNKLWAKEEQNLNCITLKPIAENNNQAFAYLVNEFKGWENKNALNVFFKHAYLGQSNIENLKKSIGEVAPQVSDEPVEALLKRKDLSDSGKIDILKELFTDLSKNINVFYFLSEHLLNGSNKKDNFETAPFYFSKSISNHLSSLSAFEKSFSQVEKMINANLIDKEACSDISKLLQNIQPGALLNVRPGTVTTLASLIEKQISPEEKENILGTIFYSVFKKDSAVKQEHFSKLYELWQNDLNADSFSKVIESKIADTGITNSICSNYKMIEALGNTQYKKNLFDKVLNENILGVSLSLDSESHSAWLKNIKDNDKLWTYYDAFFNSDKLPPKMNESTMIFHLSAFVAVVDNLKRDNPDIELNLKEKNPLVEKFDELNSLFNIQGKDLHLNSYALRNIYPELKNSLNKLTNDIFEGKISWHEFKDTNLTNSINALNYTFRTCDMSVSDIIKPKAKDKDSFSFLSMFKTKEITQEIVPYYLSMKEQNITLSSEPFVTEIVEDFKKSDFVSKAHKEYGQIKKYLESVGEKPLSLDVKIKSNNLMLDYINFVTLIDSAKTMVAIEDMHFLENNLGTYLLESLRSYTKNVDRFEVMQKAHDSGNFKKLFSGKTEDDMQNLKDKSDNECLRWIKLLEEQLELVKKNIIEQINEDGLHDMKVRTKFLHAKFPEASLEVEKATVVKIK